MTRVLALDPGDKVGWARADVSSTGTWDNLRHGITPLRDMALTIHKRMVSNPYDVIVCEDWRLYPTKAKEMRGSSFPSVQFIGMVRLCCWTSGAQLVMQGASIKRTADKTMDKKLQDLVNVPRAHDDAHDLDAIRHLWYWTWKTRIVPSLQSKERSEGSTD